MRHTFAFSCAETLNAAGNATQAIPPMKIRRSIAINPER